MRTRNIHGIRITGSDINGDGFTEIVTGSRSNSGRNSFINVFDAEGGHISEFQVGESSRYLTSVASADMDGDGAAEIVAGTVHSTLQSTEVTVYDAFGTEKMTFTLPKTPYGVNLAVPCISS